jgi:hypothetical protein
MALDPKRVDKAFRKLIRRVDYDTHKYIECDENSGKDRYPELAKDFIEYYEAAEGDAAALKEWFAEDDSEEGE